MIEQPITIASPTAQHSEYTLPFEYSLRDGGMTKASYEACDALTHGWDREDENFAEFATISTIYATLTGHRQNVIALTELCIWHLSRVSGDDEYADYYPQLCQFTYAYCYAIGASILGKFLAQYIISSGVYRADENLVTP